MLQRILYCTIVQVKLHKLGILKLFCSLWEHLLDELCDILVIDVVATILWQSLALRDHKIHQTTEEAVEVKVQLVSEELSL